MAAGSTGQVSADTQGSFRDYVHIPCLPPPGYTYDGTMARTIVAPLANIHLNYLTNENLLRIFCRTVG